MRNKIITHLSNGLLIAGAAAGLYAFADILIRRGRLPAGTCPVTDNRLLIYAAITFCFISFILSFFEGKKKKEDNKIE